MATMLLRFTLLDRDPQSGRKRGVLVAAHHLRDSDELTWEEHRVMQEALRWFNQHLHVPSCLRDPQNRRALSWFKSEAKTPLCRMWALVEILKAHDVQVELHKTRAPGRVIYEDGWQVVAKPVRGRKASW
jgi:hypothetical protein